jgi:hypothetical protein
MNPGLIETLQSQFNQMVNDQHRSPEFELYYSTPLTAKRVQFREQMRLHYIRNRRTCWAYVQARSPLDVQKVIWQHEQDELIRDERAGCDHYTLAVEQSRRLGVRDEEVANGEPPPLVRAALYAHIYLVSTLPWLGALVACHILERRNSGKIVKGGGASERWRQKLINEMGIAEERLPDSNVHVVADVDHAELVWQAIVKHIIDQLSYNVALEGAKESLAIDRAINAAYAHCMRQLH